MSKFQSVNTPRAFVEVAEQIKLAILEGDFTPGDFLPPERELIEQFEVSRTTIREAVRTLEQMGLCEVVRGAHGGTRIKTPGTETISNSLRLIVHLSEQRLEEAVEARFFLERETAGLAAVRATPEEIEKLDRLAERMREGANNKDANKYMEADVLFHISLAAASHNFLFESMMTSMEPVIREIIHDLSDYPELRMQGVMLHKEIVNAIREHNPELARSAITRMLAAPVKTVARKEQ